MATSRTRNLKLIIESTTTDTAKYNLERIDSLAEVFYRDGAGNLNIRAEAAINLLPNNINAGGSGSGGVINVGTAEQPIGTLAFWANTVDFGTTSPSMETLRIKGATYYTDIKAATGGQTSNLTFKLPANYGTSGQVLSTDGNGVLSWTDLGGGGGPTLGSMSATWAPGDGATKVIIHNFGTRKVVVTVLDTLDSYRDIEVDISRPTDNTVQLESAEVPTGNWLVLLSEVQ